MSNKVKYGLKNVYYAVATVDEDNKATYATPVAIKGAVNLSLDAQGDTTKFRADNMNYWIGQSNNGYDGDFEVALIPDSFKKDVLGYKQDADGALYEVDIVDNVSITANSNQLVEWNVSVPENLDGGVFTAKAFVWNSLSGLVPVGKAVTVAEMY